MTEKNRFSSPTSSKTDEKRELLKILLKKKGIDLEVVTTIPRRPQFTPVELSFAQQRLFFLDTLERDVANYNISTPLHLTGVLNVAALAQTVAEIVRRHEILRTTFPIVDGNPVQAIGDGTITIETIALARSQSIDLQFLQELEQFERVQSLITEEAKLPFDLATGPLMRLTLLRLGEQSHVLLLTVHHIISDSWSTGIFIREVGILYEAFCEGKPSPLPGLSIQYADFAHWQRQWLTGGKTGVSPPLQLQLDYWLQQLAGAPTLLKLPTDRSRPSVRTFQGDTEDFELKKPMTQKLQSLSQQSGATLFMTLLAAFATLLSRYSSMEDIVVGSPIANRNRPEIEPLIGFFVNTLVLRTNLEGNPTFLELLNRVKQVALDAYAHQDLPFEQLVLALQPERSLSHSPLFQVMFVLQNAPVGDLKLPGLSITPIEIKNTTAKFDLLLSMTETDAGLIGSWDYNSDLFDAETIQRMSGHFQTLLTAIVAEPGRKLDDLPILSAIERQQLVIEWNRTEREYPLINKCVHQLVEAQVERTPDAIAVIFEDQQLTYRELNERANQLGNYLQRLGVGPETLVGICIERSLEMAIGLLGILKAGGAYVPLDLTYPKERLAFMVEDSQVSVLLTLDRARASLPQNNCHLVCLDAEWKTILLESKSNPVSGVKAENLIYVIYTSGSTGKPKGAMNTHQALCNRLLWMQEAYQLTSLDRVLQKTPFSFDVSFWEIFWPLMIGASTIVAKPEGHKDSAYLVKLIVQQQITTLHLVPSMLQVFLEEQGLEACSCLRQVFCGGEVLSFDLLRSVKARLGCRLHNLYGPTEAAIDVTFWECELENSRQKVLLGRPIANTQLYILDRYLQPVPIGVPGELHIGGIGLGRGYLNRPDLTAEKFITNPFSDRPGARLYKTGDLARFERDGNIEFLGRIDHQVKLRGVRIELGEIETVLSQHPFVRQAAVIVREDQSGNKYLVAYVVPAIESIDTSDLRSFLKKKLPEYMVPSVFVLLEKLPLHPNGKLDRMALPAQDSSKDSRKEVNLVQPSTSNEKILATIWAQVLGLEQIGIHDNFFELGGDSIKIIQIVSRLAQHNLKLKEKQLFEYPTIAELAGEVVESYTRADQSLMSGDVPLTPIQARFFSTYSGNKNHFNQSLMLAITTTRLDAEALLQVVQQIQLHHDALRLRFRFVDGKVVQEYGGCDHPFSFEVVDLVGQIDAISQLEAKADRVQASMNLETGPLMRFVLFHLDGGDRLLMVAHHLVIDGVSWRILLEDLSKGYEQVCVGSEIRFPAKTDSYQRWAMALQKYSTSQALLEEIEYWQYLAASAVDDLAIDVSDTPGALDLAREQEILAFTLTPEETNLLLTEVHLSYNTEINDILLTALALSLNAWCGGRRFLIDLEGHGRVDDIDEVDVSRTVGWFTSIYPVLLEGDITVDLGYQIKYTKEMLRRIPHKGIGYGIRRYLTGSQYPQSLIIQQDSAIAFNYLGGVDSDIDHSRFSIAVESVGHLSDPSSKLTHELEFSGFVYDGKLTLSVKFSAMRFQEQTVQKLINHYELHLKAIVQHCLERKTSELTPSDLTYGNLSLEEFDEIFAED